MSENQTPDHRITCQEAKQHFEKVQAAVDTMLDAIRAVQGKARSAGLKGDRKKAKRLYREALEMRESMDSIQSTARNLHNNIDSSMRGVMFMIDSMADYTMFDIDESENA